VLDEPADRGRELDRPGCARTGAEITMRYPAAVTINGAESAAASLDPATRAVLIKLLSRLIDLLGIDEARALTPDLVGYLAGPPRGEGLLTAAQRARAVARQVLR
jgi:hypothetical protein